MPDTIFHAVRDKKMKEQSLPLEVLQYGQGDDTFTRNNNSHPTEVRSELKMQANSLGAEENRVMNVVCGKASWSRCGYKEQLRTRSRQRGTAFRPRRELKRNKHGAG